MGTAHRAGHPCTGPHLISPYRHQPSAGGRGIGRMRRTAPARVPVLPVRMRPPPAIVSAAGATGSATLRERVVGPARAVVMGRVRPLMTYVLRHGCLPPTRACPSHWHARVAPVPTAQRHSKGCGVRPAAGQGPRPPHDGVPHLPHVASMPRRVRRGPAVRSAQPEGARPGAVVARWTVPAMHPPRVRARPGPPARRRSEARCGRQGSDDPGGSRSPDPLSSPRSSAGTVPPPPTGVPVPPGRRFRPPRGSGPPARSGR